MSTPIPTLELSRTVDDYEALALQILRPPPSEDIWDWCGKNLMLFTGHRWVPEKSAIMRHWYRVVQARLSGKPDHRVPYAHRCEQLYLGLGAQLTKSTLLRATIYAMFIGHPRMSGLFLDRKADLTNIRERKMLREVEKTPALAKLLPAGTEARERALGSLSWAIGAGLLYWRSACVADDIRADPLELILGDEFDTFPDDVEGYGDPIDQMLDRQIGFPKTRLLIASSTPGIAEGHAWRRICTGSHERPLIDCPHCGATQYLDPANIALAGGRQLAEVKGTEIRRERLGRWICQQNGCTLDANDIHQAIAHFARVDRPWCPGEWVQDKVNPNGKWTAHADLDAHGRLVAIPPSDSSIMSGTACALYSRDVTLDDFCAKAATAKRGTAAQQKTFTNNSEANPYILNLTTVDTDQLAKELQPEEPYRLQILTRTAKWISLMFDQQGNTESLYWFPFVARCWEPGGESWLLDAGKTTSENGAKQRDDIERKQWMVDGRMRGADQVICDSANGNAKFQMWMWAAANRAKRMLVRGDPKLAEGLPWELVPEQSLTRKAKNPKPAGVREYRIAPHLWRDRLWARMTRAPGSPGWWIPSDVPDWYLASLTSENQIMARVRTAGGFKQVPVWAPRILTSSGNVVTFRTDNHWWDSEADSLAVADIMGWLKPPPPPPDPNRPIIHRERRGGIMDGYR